MITVIRLRLVTRAWCALADTARVLMIAANRRWLASDTRLAGADTAAWQRSPRAVRMGRAHGHYRVTAGYRPARDPFRPWHRS